MTGDVPKKGLKSVGAAKPMRSRGFLSQPGAARPPLSGPSEETSEATKHHRSRGARQASVSKEGQPEDLTTRSVIKPYKLENE